MKGLVYNARQDSYKSFRCEEQDEMGKIKTHTNEEKEFLRTIDCSVKQNLECVEDSDCFFRE